MPSFTQFSPAPASDWLLGAAPAARAKGFVPVRPAGQLRVNPGVSLGGTDPGIDPCALPLNPNAGQPGVNDPSFATDADRTAWIAAHPTCVIPPPFLPPSIGQVSVLVTPPPSVSLPSDLVVTVDGISIPASTVGGVTYPGTFNAVGLTDGPHVILVKGSGFNPSGGTVTVSGGNTVPFVVNLTPNVAVSTCAGQFASYLAANPLIQPGTSAYAAFMAANPTCIGWANSQIAQQHLVPVNPTQIQPTNSPTNATGISWGTVLLTGLIVGGVGYLWSQNSSKNGAK